MAAYLPPVVVEFLGNAKDVASTITELKTMLADFSKTPTEKRITGNSKDLKTELLVAGREAAAWAAKPVDKRIGADAAAFTKQLIVAGQEAAAFAAKPVDKIIGGNSKPFMADLLAANRMLATWGHDTENARLGAKADYLAALAAAKAAMAEWGSEIRKARLGLNAGPFYDQLRDVRTLLAAYKPDIEVNANTDVATAKLLEWKAWADAQKATMRLDIETGALSPLLLSRGGRGGGFLSSFVGAEAGGGGGGGGWLAALMGRNKGGGGGWMRALPAFGSIGSLAGFGLETMLMHALGIGGAVAGGLAGGGLLAGGALSTMAVGMGTDLAGIGQASGDIRTVYADMNNLNQAIAVYGKNSYQAIAAQKQLNYDLSTFSPIARQAVLNAAKMAGQLKAMFDAATGLAEKRGANIITAGMKVAIPFIPIIGKYSAANMKTMEAGLQPFFKWLDSNLSTKVRCLRVVAETAWARYYDGRYGWTWHFHQPGERVPQAVANRTTCCRTSL